ncbi:hypothetical protein KFE25_001054 [Diacronema lutheri]|uniref:GPN-loop GTPase n=2 Tax=Diacronema lutheri TaxID=2081491 RepID=A0A8J6C9C6_DIALT|nr:hypothetical protein KFE25_001054 [Diacronema lutheri]
MAGTSVESAARKPVVAIMIGMAGSGKTTLMQRLHADLEAASSAFYSINLDPAVRNLAYEPDIDVRETVDYKGVMKQYQLGPNGGILTALNLFATKFDQVLSLVERRVASETPPAHVLIDTPGQIEIFTWSASGAVITEALAASLPTVIVYVIDTPRSARPVTFMSNMLYACSILYKFRLPLVLVFNKTDVLPADFATEWMADCEAFQAALDGEKAYIGSLSRSMALMLDEFYSQLRAVHVSALTGDGVPELLDALQTCAHEYQESYAVDLAARRAKRDAEAAEAARQSVQRLEQDRAEEAAAHAGAATPAASGPVAVAAAGGAGASRVGPTLTPHGTRAVDRDALAEADEADGDGPVRTDVDGDADHDTGADADAELESFRAYLEQKRQDTRAADGET